MPDTNLAHIEISKANLVHNIKQFRKILNNKIKIVSVIKANAYGHGDALVAEVLHTHTDYFAVNSVAEVENIRKITKKEIFVLGYIQKADIAKAIKLGCVIPVFSLDQLEAVSKTAEKLKKAQKINLAVDAHLGREGFLVADLLQVFELIKKSKHLKLQGMYAHFANMEDTMDFYHAQTQIEKYREALALAKSFGFRSLPAYGGIETHISSTSGTLVYETRAPYGGKNVKLYDAVRVGIGLYGMWPSEDIKKMYEGKITLKPVMSWKTKVAQVKTLGAGESVGYGLTYITKKETKVAVIPQGYADGYDRGLSGKGEVLIGGTRCKVLGRVMMNMFVVDVNHLKNVASEDEVVLLGKQGREEITAEEIAGKLYTINYEITTRISALLPRVFS